MAELTFYYKPSCPYCQKVLNHMDRNGISVPLKDRENPAVREELIRIGGKPQVPCLVIDGKPLYESDDILHWFQSNWPKP